MKDKKINLNLLSFAALIYFLFGIFAALLRLPYTFAFSLLIGFLAAIKIIFVVEGRRIVEAIEGKNAK